MGRFSIRDLDSDYSCASSVLDVSPNTKELTVSKREWKNLNFSNLLYKPVSNKRPLPITKLEFEYRQTFEDNFDNLDFGQYCKTSPNNIKELTVYLQMFKHTADDFVASFFTGIAHCKELRKLQLHCRKTTHPCLGFLTPFRAIKLPKLTTFCVDGMFFGEDLRASLESNGVTFDLKTIAGMPNLELFKIEHFYDYAIKKWVVKEAEPPHQIRFEGMEKVDTNNERTGSANLKSLDFNSRRRSNKPSRAEVEQICQWGLNLERINGYPVSELLSVDDDSSSENSSLDFGLMDLDF